MTEVRGSDVRAHTFRPRSHLFGQLVTATAVLAIPIFAALYWLTIPDGSWPVVLAIQVIAMLLIGVAILSSRNVYVELHDWGVEDHWPFGFTRRVRAADVDTVLLVDVYSGNGMETSLQLFAVDEADRRILRMRGQVWSRAAMQQVAARLAAPVVHAPVPMTLGEFSRIEPQLLSWFERRPLWASKRGPGLAGR
ncbi:MAG: hypothetical protein ABWY36_08155 [Leifsonia sp.]